MNLSRLVPDQLAIRGLIYGIVAFVAVGLISDFAEKSTLTTQLRQSAAATSSADLAIDSALGAAQGMLVYFCAGILTGWFVFRLAPERDSHHHASAALAHGVLLGSACSIVSVGALMILTNGIPFGRTDWTMLLVNVALTICFCTLGTTVGTFVARHRFKSRSISPSEE